MTIGIPKEDAHRVRELLIELAKANIPFKEWIDDNGDLMFKITEDGHEDAIARIVVRTLKPS